MWLQLKSSYHVPKICWPHKPTSTLRTSDSLPRIPSSLVLVGVLQGKLHHVSSESSPGNHRCTGSRLPICLNFSYKRLPTAALPKPSDLPLHWKGSLLWVLLSKRHMMTLLWGQVLFSDTGQLGSGDRQKGERAQTQPLHVWQHAILSSQTLFRALQSLLAICLMPLKSVHALPLVLIKFYS